MKNKHFILSLLFLLFASPAFAQIDIYAGPAITGGLIMHKNVAVDDTSRFYINATGGMAMRGGLDVGIGFEENWKFQVGIQYSYRKFSMAPDNPVEGISFSSIDRKVTHLSIPTMLNYRIPLGNENPLWINLMAGHSLDLTKADSTVIREPLTPVDSGGSFFRHEFITVKKIVPTVLLGVGVEYEFNSGSLLDISLIYGASTGVIYKGDLREWTTVNQNFDPAVEDKPMEFPDAYYDFGLRGSYLGLRISYWFNIATLFGDDD